ncbi:MAG: G-D-S-L family lipolytic protein [Chlorogloeopsis fritschii C42_A2020_084]|uniref:GDSL-type esterase/lipase family protein n=1 Tax=Chlorogloeopsis fritschii TaxID=1124 RepID=UPI0019E05B5C|nr:GDSL-type esterase/lipase family protein [Chlorogloeopsis fritschii]MBF2007908.1 G-D-S-L family lipolytic protein [Chlorogloeopsis fritschii C42_A2020_084]
MNNQVIFLLWISVGINILCFFIGGFIFLKKARYYYLFLKTLKFLNLQKSLHLDYPPYYWHKKSQYELLPQTESEIIMLGDSITDEGEWIELLGNIKVKNRGISGDTTERILYRLSTIIASQPKQIFLMIGINDLINSKKSVIEILESYQEILKEFQEKTPHTEIFIQSVLPVHNKIYIYWHDNKNIINLNLGLQKLAQKFNYKYVDLFSKLIDSENQLDVKYTVDGLHLNGHAYLVWKSVIEKYVATSEIQKS